MHLTKESLCAKLAELKNSHEIHSVDYQKGYEVGLIMAEGLLEYVFMRIGAKNQLDVYEEILDIQDLLEELR
jgi:hypothetical protein